ncbi:MAG: DUF4345 family protein [Pseudomonadota bacterium]
MDRIFLGLAAASFFVFGVASFIQPADVLGGVGVEFAGEYGIYEARGIYGGVSLGLATLFAMGAFRSDYRRPALFALLAYAGGYVAARFAAAPLDGAPEGLFLTFVGFEIFLAAGAALFLARSRSAD